MGLDSVELLMEVEYTFDIVISDPEAEKISTVGELYDCVWDKIKNKQCDKCFSAMFFYKLRRLIFSKYDFAKKDFKPETNLNELIPKSKRKSLWNDIKKEFEYKIPKLELPILLGTIFFYTGIIVIIGTLLIAINQINYFENTNVWYFKYLMPIFGVIFLLFLNLITRPLKIYFGQNSVRGFIEKVMALNYKHNLLNVGTNRKEMERVINLTIQEKIGVDLAEIKPEANFRNDLGVD